MLATPRRGRSDRRLAMSPRRFEPTGTRRRAARTTSRPAPTASTRRCTGACGCATARGWSSYRRSSCASTSQAPSLERHSAPKRPLPPGLSWLSAAPATPREPRSWWASLQGVVLAVALAQGRSSCVCQHPGARPRRRLRAARRWRRGRRGVLRARPVRVADAPPPSFGQRRRRHPAALGHMSTTCV